ncbi:hypothetical protein [Pseudoalteromonas denitrificans]|uniref:Uncharacterized protein n=1 Tax=Pseudoalteromonas denitrificans DSM 6059 TaxID=1123010 RepID=A0A1I1Q2U4_9GAMM|nr:hypothetical protein [Pseudoalteromonas denitrificans]SFD16466.1 hypothetical protein SAMN02745724_03714 [Pseudoalteromonas denitrificans DSM 6059]
MATTSELLAKAVGEISVLNKTYEQEVTKWQTERAQMQTLLQQSKQTFNDYISTARREVAAINLLKNAQAKDITGDGKLDLPFQPYTAHVDIEATVYDREDEAVPEVISNIKTSMLFNPIKLIITKKEGIDRETLLIPYNPVFGKISVGFVALYSPTSGINIHGVGELEENRLYQKVVCNQSVSRNHNIDLPKYELTQDTCELWMVGPWISAGYVEKDSIPLFIDGAIYHDIG